MTQIVNGLTNEWVQRTAKTIAFDGTAGNGAVGSLALWTVTGEVAIVYLVAHCSEDLASAGGGTLALGVTGATTLFIAATTATDIDSGEFWVDATPDANGIAVPAALRDIAITDNIICTIATGDITDGTLRFDLYWLPLSADGNAA